MWQKRGKGGGQQNHAAPTRSQNYIGELIILNIIRTGSINPDSKKAWKKKVAVYKVFLSEPVKEYGSGP